MSPREYEYLRRKQAYDRAMEEERRRQYYLRRQQVEKERQRQAYIRMMEEEEARERAALEREATMMAMQQSKEDAKYGEEPTYKPVRGPDGQLYRIHIEKENEEDEEEEAPYDYVRDWDGTIYRVPRRARSTKEATRKQQLKQQTVKNSCFNPMTESRQQLNAYPNGSPGGAEDDDTFENRGLPQKKTSVRRAIPKQAKKEPQKLKKKITVLVEDVESDTEDDELNSYWRNRHPSPGESWMEPVQL